jgi:hypothetical protein
MRRGRLLQLQLLLKVLLLLLLLLPLVMMVLLRTCTPQNTELCHNLQPLQRQPCRKQQHRRTTARDNKKHTTDMTELAQRPQTV